MQVLDKPSLRELLRQAKTQSPLTLEICRHGATALNGIDNVSVDRERGWSNVPLTEEGRQEAIDAGTRLKGRGIGAIVSSDLNRAIETAEIIGQILNLKPKHSFKLRPWGLGTLTHQEMSAVAPKLARYARDLPDTPVEGGGESFNQFRLRMFDGVASAVRQNWPSKVLLICHLRVERGLKAWNAAGQPIEHMIDIPTFLKGNDPTGNCSSITTNRQLLDGRLDVKLTHTQADYGPGYDGEFCRTCRYSDHQSPPKCSFVEAIDKRGYCRLWKAMES